MSTANEKSFDGYKSILNSTFVNSFFESSSCSKQEYDSVNVEGIDVTTEASYNSEIINKIPRDTSHGGGGITCCVLLCHSNCRRNKDLSFYVIPHDLKLRKKWLVMISRKNFIPTR